MDQNLGAPAGIPRFSCSITKNWTRNTWTVVKMKIIYQRLTSEDRHSKQAASGGPLWVTYIVTVFFHVCRWGLSPAALPLTYGP